jgi:hypothetical protein
MVSVTRGLGVYPDVPLEWARGRHHAARRVFAAGQAVKVEVEHEQHHGWFDVFVRSGDATKKYKIDGLSGKVR